MAISVPFPPPATGGPISGELVDTFTDSAEWQIGLWFRNQSGTWQVGAPIPAAPVWSFGAAQAGTLYVAAVISTKVTPLPNTPPPLSATVANLATFPPNRLSVTATSGSGSTTLAGTVTLGVDPSQYHVMVYGLQFGTGWQPAGQATVSAAGAWTLTSTAAVQQWAALLVPPGWTAGPLPAGVLPQNVVNTAFTGGVRARVQAWPGAGGGPLNGVLSGLARGGGLVAFALSVQPDGSIWQTSVPVLPSNTFSFDAVRRGTSYAVVISDTAEQYFLQVPGGVGGHVITWAVSP